MTRRNRISSGMLWCWAAVAAAVLAVPGCGDDKKKIGSACDQDTVCDGVCLLSLPGGMCARECNENQECSKGRCVRIAGGYYCLPSCDRDSDCRTSEGYVCAIDVCRTPAGLGEPCAENTDCNSQMLCVAQQCGAPCMDSTGCGEGFYCLEENGQSACAPDDCSSGVCSRTCEEHRECAVGTYCGPNGFCVVDTCDANGICVHPCDYHADCPDGTYCADVSGERHCVFVPEDLGPGTTGHQCATDDCQTGYICLSRSNEDAYAYCTEVCTSDLDCPPAMLCRETMNAQSQVVNYCFFREYCESCTFDDQCGFANERCVAADPAQGQGGYCSAACDPQRADTCPVDSACLEASFCETTGLWVSDCAWCSGNCGPIGAVVYQCFQDWGACVGDGSLCSPCQHDGHCSSGGGQCLTFNSSGISFCSAPVDANDRCPDEFWEPPDLPNQCIPRQASCSDPSGGMEMCDYCDILFDCVSGSCVSFGGWDVCLDECTPALNDCPAYTACVSTVDIHDLTWNMCVPQGQVDTCGKLNHCLLHCPTGPTSCDGQQNEYCN